MPPTEPDIPAGHKLSVYVPRELVARIRAQAKRLDRSASFVLCRAWRLAEKQIEAMPSTSLEPPSPPGAKPC